MSFIAQIPVIGPFLATAIPFVFVLSVIVFVHEYGHYIVGRWRGIKADAFAIGFGAEIVGWTDKRGMRWKLCWIPLGGYVKFRGDANAASGGADGAAVAAMTEEQRRECLHTAPLLSRALTVAAGPVFNFILAIALYAGLAMSIGKESPAPVIGEIAPDSPAALAGLESGDRILSIDGAPVLGIGDFYQAIGQKEGQAVALKIERAGIQTERTLTYIRKPLVDMVSPSGAAAAAGIEAGDLITAVDGVPVTTFEQLRRLVDGAGGASLLLTVQRGAEAFDVTLTPQRQTFRNAEGELEDRFLIGIRNAQFVGVSPERETVGPVEALSIGVTRTGQIIGGSLMALYDLANGWADSGDLGGPISIARISGAAAESGFASLVAMAAMLSASIGLLNLFPIPVLDGGHLVFYAIEAVRGKPLGERAQEIAFLVGFALILSLMAFATYNDVVRL